SGAMRRITPFMIPTYGSSSPKSVKRVMTGGTPRFYAGLPSTLPDATPYLDVRWVVLLLLVAACEPAVTYERSPQWRNGHFANLVSWPTRTGGRDFLKWQLGGRPPAPRGFRAPFVDNDG